MDGSCHTCRQRPYLRRDDWTGALTHKEPGGRRTPGGLRGTPNAPLHPRKDRMPLGNWTAVLDVAVHSYATDPPVPVPRGYPG